MEGTRPGYAHITPEQMQQQYSQYGAEQMVPQQMPTVGLGGVVGAPGQPMMGALVPQQPGAAGSVRTDMASMAAQGDLLEDLLGPFPVVRLRGLPFEASARDVIVFFQGIGVLDVVLLQRGEAIVVFNTVMDCQMALGRDRQNMGRRYIEVFQAKRFDYYIAITQTWAGGSQSPNGRHMGSPSAAMGRGAGLHRQPQVPVMGPGGGLSRPSPSSETMALQAARDERAATSGILKLRGLPFSANKQDVYHFFEGYNVRHDGVNFVYRPDGRLTGEAFVQFATADDARSAHRNKDRSMIGSRYVELFPSTPEEMVRLTGQAKPS